MGDMLKIMILLMLTTIGMITEAQTTPESATTVNLQDTTIPDQTTGPVDQDGTSTIPESTTELEDESEPPTASVDDKSTATIPGSTTEAVDQSSTKVVSQEATTPIFISEPTTEPVDQDGTSAIIESTTELDDESELTTQSTPYVEDTQTNADSTTDEFDRTEASTNIGTVDVTTEQGVSIQSETTSPAYSTTGPCHPELEFQCIIGGCVNDTWVCDGDSDCFDGSDEINCTTCSEGTYKCSSGGCISERLRCDYVADCVDGSDETIDCVCNPKVEFQCIGGGCVDETWVCDGMPDCFDGSDETIDCVCNPKVEFQCFGGGCVDETWVCDGVSDCFDGSDEYNCTGCSDILFQCADGTCIPDHWQCDADDDCGDNSDELGCVCDEFQCSNGVCIPYIYLCDDDPDCVDGDDETNCTDCGQLEGLYQCPNGDCILETWVCDGETDCSDGSDEINCTTCSEGAYKCSSGGCIMERLRCDYVADCADGSDETIDCVCNPKVEFQCFGGGCVDETWVCDGVSDCFDGSDEYNCTGCSDILFQCANGTCIPDHWQCDADDDCGDNSDELGCVCDEFQCSNGVCIPYIYLCDDDPDCVDGDDETNCTDCGQLEGLYQCPNGDCILETWVCDGETDCSDGSDEINCTTCSEGAYKCSSGGCIMERLRCDYVADCADGSDETIDCVCNPKVEFQCISGGCIDDTGVCDGKPDCFDGSDEIDCTQCAEGAYQCADRSCILEIFICNYFNDCGDNSDEVDCVCDLDNEIQCVIGGCVLDIFACDGDSDCFDGSDEASELCSNATEAQTTAGTPTKVTTTEATTQPGVTTTLITDIDDCAAFHCQHGSTCIDGLRSYTCNCRPRFSGIHCENYCETDSDCDNGGSCDQGECVCSSCEFYGNWCEQASHCFENSLTLEELGGEPIEFTADLNDPTSQRFIDLVNRITPLIDSLIFSTMTIFKHYYSDSLVITGFEEGSVQVNYQFQITAEASLTPEDIQKDIQQAISEGKVPQLGVKEGSVNAKELGGPPNTQSTKVFVYLGSGITLFVIMCIFIRYAGNGVLRADKEHQLMLHFLTAFSGLLIMFLLLVIFVDSTIKGLDVDNAECSVLAGFTHYFFLVSGAITVAQTVSITRNKFKSGTTVAVSFAWGIPLILVPIIGAVTQDNYAEQQFCMLAEEVLLVTLVAPLGVFLLINIVLYIKSLNHSKNKLVPVKQVKKNLIIVFLVAFTWTSGILSFIPGVPVVTTRPLFFVCCAVLAFAFIMVYARTGAKSLEIYHEGQGDEMLDHKPKPKEIELADFNWLVDENDADSEAKDKTMMDSEDVMDSPNAEEEISDKEDDKQDKEEEKDDIQDEDKGTEDAELVKSPDEEEKEGEHNEGFEKEEDSSIEEGSREMLI